VASLGNPVSQAKVVVSVVPVVKAALLEVAKAASAVRPRKAMRQNLKAISQKIQPDPFSVPFLNHIAGWPKGHPAFVYWRSIDGGACDAPREVYG
jgi:hypothetical protein